MTTSYSSPLDALSALLEERGRFEGWLAQLESRRGQSPAHVVDRVRGDYLRRLEGVVEQLRGRASELEASADSLRERIAILQHEELNRRDERYEMELRSLVGEYEPEHAQRSMSACDEAIATLSAERVVHAAELARVSEVLASVAPAPPLAPPPQPDVAPDRVLHNDAPHTAESTLSVEDSTNPMSEPAAVRIEHASALETGSLTGVSHPSQQDELAFLQSVVESHDSAPPGPVLSEPIGMDAARRIEESSADLLPPTVLAAPRRPATPLSSSVPTGPASRDPYASTTSTLTPGSMPSYFKDMPTEQVKTLKCQECGTMNYPTEWYCERCGGELAAM